MMKQAAAVGLAVLAMAGQAVAAESDYLARFDGGIGVQPVSNVAGPANPDGTFQNVRKNVVRGVAPAGPWRIAELKAEVAFDGRISVKGRGLLLASGNSIGTNANARVFATLFCEASAQAEPHSTSAVGVALEPNGDFRIDDLVNPAPPETCASPALLIRVSGSGAWFAAGIPRLEQD
jgi:hypothetical protein